MEPISQVGPRAAAPPRLRKACAEFESLFLNYVMKSARSSVSGSGLFGSDNGGKIIRSMFDETLSKEIAAGGGVGMGDLLFDQLRGHTGVGNDR